MWISGVWLRMAKGLGPAHRVLAISSNGDDNPPPAPMTTQSLGNRHSW